MLAASRGRVTNTDYDVLLGLVWLATTVTLSIRRPAGAVLAGLVTALAPELIKDVPASTFFMQMLFGLGAIGLARDPEGGLSAGARVKRERSARRAAKQRAAVAGAATAPAGAVAADAPSTTPLRVGVATATPVEAADGNDASAQPVLRVTGLKAGYDEIEVLHGIDLTVGAGEAVALLGSNGAGKTTLCSVVGGLVPVRAGGVWLAGQDVTRVPARRRERDSVYLAPEGRGIFPDLTVEENLMLWLRAADEREAAYDAFPVLRSRRNQPAGTMSGGEQQMLTLAPALVRPPKLLVADEPSLGLAPLIIDQIFDALRQLQSRSTALLIAEEKTRDALAIADRVAFLTVGHISWMGPAGEVDAQRLATAYLGIAAEEGEPAPAVVGGQRAEADD